jgi:hypothetical protein
MFTYLIFIILFIASHLIRVIYAYTKNRHDFPIGVGDMCIFHEDLHCSCHIFAKGLFFILTGIKLDCLPILGVHITNCIFDAENIDNLDPTTEYVKYIGLSWNIKDRSAFHALVYYDGYIYQSYGTFRYKWKWLQNDYLLDSYPPIVCHLTPDQNKVFTEKEVHMTVQLFNEICAPSTRHLPENTTFTVVNYFIAKPNIHRYGIDIHITKK